MRMGSWPLPEVETRETRSLARAASCERTGPVFTAFRNAISSPWGGCNAMNPARFSARFETRSGRCPCVGETRIGAAQLNRSEPPATAGGGCPPKPLHRLPHLGRQHPGQVVEIGVAAAQDDADL